VWWVDIRSDRVHALDVATGQVQSIATPATLSAVWPSTDGALICAARHGLARWDVATNDFSYVCQPELERHTNRFNDASADRQGRFWAGSMDDDEQGATGALYRLDHDGTCTRVLDDIGVPNSLAWSPDGTTMYFADTWKDAITAYRYNVTTGEISEPRTFANTDGGGHPDGSTVDAEGFLWNAEWDGWRVVRYKPSGSIDRVIELPVQRPTKCEFGGEALDTLYVSTASHGLTSAQLDGQPLAGLLLALDVGATGVAPAPYGAAA